MACSFGLLLPCSRRSSVREFTPILNAKTWREWSAEQVVAAYGGQPHGEQVFRGLKDGDWLGWGPLPHWADSKIRVHAFYCLLGISLLKSLQRDAQGAWPGLSVDQLLEELRGIQQVVLRYPPQGEKGLRASLLGSQ
jgi:transposase